MKICLVTLALCTVVLFCLAGATARRCSPEQGVRDQSKFCLHKSLHLKSVSTIHISPACQDLDLSYNELTEVGNFALIQLTLLLFLDLSHNNIRVLHPHSFSGLTKLTCLDLSYNSLNISYIAYPKRLFFPLRNLKLLDIGNNIISDDLREYPDLTFQDLHSLEELHLDMFEMVHFGPGFSHLVNLKRLSASENCDTYKLYDEMFSAFANITLTSLDLSWCGPYYMEELIFEPLSFLAELDISNNHVGLRNVFKTLGVLKGGNLSVINFANVNSDSAPIEDQSLTTDMFKYIQDFCIISLDLSDNSIVSFDYGIYLQLRHPECLKVIKLNHLYLPSRAVILASIAAQRYRNLRVIELAGSVFRKKLTKYRKRPKFQPTKNITVFIQATLEVFNVSGITFECNRENIFFKMATSIHTFNVSNSELIQCVFYGLENLRALDISGVYLPDLKSRFFTSFPNLTYLGARDTSLKKLFESDRSVFQQLKRLQHLDIGNCGLTVLPTSQLLNQPDLEKLDLSFNKLTSIPDIVFSLDMLKEVDLRYNAITDIYDQHRKGLDNFVRKHGGLSLLLEGNPLICNCYTYDFIEWIFTSKVTFDQNGNYSCALDDGGFQPLLNLRPTLKDRKVKCVSTFWVKFGAVGSSFLLFVLFVSVIIYRYRVPIKYWYHALRGQNDTQTPTRFRYDALVAYCHDDRNWVLDHLYPVLVDPEHGHGYKLCVYDRNFLPGVPIEDSIMAAINRSYKIIMVISPAFVRSVWCRYELQLARMKMVQEGREDIIIPIILEDVPVTAMPKSLLNLWNTSVFLIWSESAGEQRHFWANLTAALGSVRIGENTEGVAEMEMITTSVERRRGGDIDDEQQNNRGDDDDILLL